MAVYRYLKVDIPKEHVTIERQSDGKPALIKYVLEAPYNPKSREISTQNINAPRCRVSARTADHV